MPISNYTYAGSLGSAIRGLEAKVEFNGLILNDRYAATNDIYRLTSIDGLDDADVRDAREIRPSTHGEIAYDAFYGGRTITLTGRIEAGNLNKLREMQENLRLVFQNLEESEMVFSFYGVNENFTRSDAAQMFTWVSNNSGSVSVSGSMSFVGSATPHIILRTQEQRKYESCNVKISFSFDGTPNVNDDMFAMLKYIDANNYAAAGIECSTGKLVLRQVINGVATETKQDGPSFGQGSWNLNCQLDREKVYCQISSAETTNEGIYSPLAETFDFDLDPALGVGYYGMSGLYVNALSTANNYTISNWSVKGINPGDVSIKVRKVGALQIKESQSNSLFQRDFLITCKASDPVFLSSLKNSRRTLPVASNNAGRIYEYNGTAYNEFDRYYSFALTNNALGFAIPTSVSSNIYAYNNGSYNAYPIIRVYGSCSGITIKNNTNEKTMSINGSIASDAYIEIDTQKKTVKTHTGSLSFGIVSITSEWITLDPGLNDISVSVSSLSGSPYTYITWKDSWM